MARRKAELGASNNPQGRWVVGELQDPMGERNLYVIARYTLRSDAEWHLTEILQWRGEAKVYDAHACVTTLAVPLTYREGA